MRAVCRVTLPRIVADNKVKEVMPEEEAVAVVVAVAVVEVDAISTEAEAVAAVVVVDFTEEDFAMIAIHLKLENLKRG
jgi:hypothetical protein